MEKKDNDNVIYPPPPATDDRQNAIWLIEVALNLLKRSDYPEPMLPEK